MSNELPNTTLPVIDLNPSCSGQANCNRPGIGHWYKSTKPGCILTILRVPSMNLSKGRRQTDVPQYSAVE